MLNCFVHLQVSDWQTCLTLYSGIKYLQRFYNTSKKYPELVEKDNIHQWKFCPYVMLLSES